MYLRLRGIGRRMVYFVLFWEVAARFELERMDGSCNEMCT
jgi:hypothetical protein